ncbi:DUF4158 domain-containing protein [Streptomyces sp. NBRC 110028]|uniref:DUF4158 domain-containing protein n=1 Tax=Streptomyces sp. NBRC 110028 TaxID=1621260 RepID=UPI0007C6983D|nr:DUF4158 domain-containing protein [Streptomyces sp. NBRC 110028]
MRQDWEPEDLIEVWTLLEDDMKRVRNKSGATRLGFALLLKFFEVEARFPESAGEVPAAAVEYVAQQDRARPAARRPSSRREGLAHQLSGPLPVQHHRRPGQGLRPFRDPDAAEDDGAED